MKFQQFMGKSLLMGLFKDYHHFFSPLSKDLKNKGLNLNEALVLLAIFFENSSEVHPSQLQKTLELPKDQISQTLSKLENKELIVRRLARSDRRMRDIKITPLGRKKSTELVKVFDQHESQYELVLEDRRSD